MPVKRKSPSIGLVAHLEDQLPAAHDLGVKYVRAMKYDAIEAHRAHIEFSRLCAFS
jgi:hypothetical protein